VYFLLGRGGWDQTDGGKKNAQQKRKRVIKQDEGQKGKSDKSDTPTRKNNGGGRSRSEKKTVFGHGLQGVGGGG